MNPFDINAKITNNLHNDGRKQKYKKITKHTAIYICSTDMDYAQGVI